MPRTTKPPAVSRRKTYAGKPVNRGRDGYTPRERLDAIHAMQAQQEYRLRQGQLVERTEVEAGHAEMREVVRSDLLGTLPLRVADALAGKKMDAQGVRETVLKAVREILSAWHKAGIPSPEET